MTTATTSGGGADLVPARLLSVRRGLGNFFAKLHKGGTLRVACLGGSITAQPGWRVKTLGWFRRRWPQCEFGEINAAIGGTGSDLGVFRVERDLLVHKPDLVFVEFALNDGGAPPERVYRTIEGIVRKTWKADPTADICFAYTIHQRMLEAYDRGLCPPSTSADERIADHYGIPSINMAMRVAELRRQGKLVFTIPPNQEPPAGKLGFSHDACHRTDAGHEVFFKVIKEAFEEIARHSRAGPHPLAEAFRRDNWEDARMVPLRPGMLSKGWRKLPPDRGLGKSFAHRLPEIWEARTPGERLSFRVRGRLVKLYDLMGPDAGRAICRVDGKVVRTVSRFDRYCTYPRLACFTVADGLAAGEHTVEVEVSAEEPDREVVLKVARGEPGFDPGRYRGTVLRVGYIMVLGELPGP